jgi:hypothetical protein
MGIYEPRHGACRCQERGEPCRCHERGEPCKCHERVDPCKIVEPLVEVDPPQAPAEPRTRRSVLMTLDPATDVGGTVMLQRWDKKKPWLRTGCERIGGRL